MKTELEITEEVLKKIYSKVYHPNSVCPDIEVGHVFDILTDIMAEQLKKEHKLNKVQSIAMARKKLFNNDSNLEYAEKVFYDPNTQYMDPDFVDDEYKLAKMEYDETLEQLAKMKLI